MNEFLIFFVTIFLSEFGDKTQLVTLSVASKTKHKMDVFWGVFFALIVIDGLAILFGSLLSTFISTKLLLTISGLIFLIYGGMTFISSHSDIKDITEDKHLKIIFSVFLMIIMAEMGDKSQITAILFASIYPAFIVFLVVILALSIMTLITIYLSHVLFDTLSSKTVQIISGTLFIIMGVFSLMNAFS